MASRNRLSRRAFLKASAAGAGGLVLTASGLAIPRLLAPFGYRGDSAFADPIYIEEYPTSPLILEPFRDELPIPRALAPVPKDVYSRWRVPPDPRTGGRQDSDGVTHQLGPEALGLPEPLVYQVKLQVAEKRFTSSKVLPIDERGNEVVPPGGVRGPRHLPPSTIYGFNGTFPGPRLNAEYGKPYVVRFENHLDENPLHLDRQDFGSPQGMFLTHLHNGHTAAESDGNPHHKPEGYLPGGWSDNLYLNYPAGSDEREKQSFYWFHDHAMDQTGANVYKGMVGLYPIYDPLEDNGDETTGYRLPGVRTNHSDGSFDVEYDIPLAIYDCVLDDGVTPHKDFHNGDGESHPEWWGKTFFRHFPNHGFVGDVFTVNGTAYPVLEVKRRKYRLRFLDASISRVYEFKLMSSTGGPVAAKDLGYGGEELQGQYRLPDGQQSMRFVQIRLPQTAACSPGPLPAIPSSCGRRSAASSSSTSPGIWMGPRPPRAT